MHACSHHVHTNSALEPNSSTSVFTNATRDGWPGWLQNGGGLLGDKSSTIKIEDSRIANNVARAVRLATGCFNSANFIISRNFEI